MSADNWSTCPRCAKRREQEVEDLKASDTDNCLVDLAHNIALAVRGGEDQ